MTELYDQMADRDPKQPYYPQAVAQLTGEDGNAFMIIGRIRTALRRAGAPADEIARFQDEATSGDYDNVLRTAMKWVTVR